MTSWKFQHFDLSLANGIQGDPAAFVFFSRSGEAILFDAGSLESLSHKDLLRVRHVCISHTHIDHFIGFDRLIRVNIPHFREISVSGPKGIIQNVSGKLKSYLWNLLEPGQVQFKVFEISDTGDVTASLISSDFAFEPQPIQLVEPKLNSVDPQLPRKPCAYVTSLSDGTRIEAVALDHGTPSIAYVCQAPCRYQVQTDQLAQLGLASGPWIRDLQIMLAEDRLDEEIVVYGVPFRARDLSGKIFVAAAPRLFGYVTDAAYNEHNLTRLNALMMGVGVLLSESNFIKGDFEKAFAKKHLTTRQAALIAASVQAGDLRVFHISNVYAGTAEHVFQEAMTEFAEFKSLNKVQLDSVVRAAFSKNS